MFGRILDDGCTIQRSTLSFRCTSGCDFEVAADGAVWHGGFRVSVAGQDRRGARSPRDFQIVAVSAQFVELPTVFVSMRMMMPGARRWRVIEIVVVLATGDDRLTDCDQVIRIPRQLPLPVRELLTSLPNYRVPYLSSVLRQQDHPS